MHCRTQIRGIFTEIRLPLQFRLIATPNGQRSVRQDPLQWCTERQAVELEHRSNPSRDTMTMLSVDVVNESPNRLQRCLLFDNWTSDGVTSYQLGAFRRT